MVNQNIQEELKKFQDKKNKDYEKTQKPIHEVIGALNKYQSETENAINREINELKVKIDNIKEELTMIWKTTEKRMKQKYKTKWKAIPADWNKQKTEPQNLKMKWKLKENLRAISQTTQDL
jgi:paraquat-inducible protein B